MGIEKEFKVFLAAVESGLRGKRWRKHTEVAGLSLS